MSRLKLTPLERHQLDVSYQNASSVLRSIKAKPLKSQALEDMKILEGAVQRLELFLVGQ